MLMTMLRMTDVTMTIMMATGMTEMVMIIIDNTSKT